MENDKINKFYNLPVERTWFLLFPVWSGSTGGQMLSRTPHHRRQAQLKTKQNNSQHC